MSLSNWYDQWNIRRPVFDDIFAPDEYDPLQRRPRGFVAGRGCPTRGNPFVVRRRSDTNVLAPIRAGVDRPVRSRESVFAPREAVRRRIGRVSSAPRQEVVVHLDCEKALEKMKKVVVERVAEELKSPVDCPICFESVANPFIFECGHMICHSDLCELLARNDLKCPQCRGNLDTANVTNKEYFLKVHAPSPSSEL